MSHRPTYSEFQQRAQSGKLVTLYRTFANDSLTPVNAFLKLHPEVGADGQSQTSAFLLESVTNGRMDRYSFVASAPVLHVEAADTAEGTCVKSTGRRPPSDNWDEQGIYHGPGDPLDALQELVDAFRVEIPEGLPSFCAGAVGYFGYDVVRYTEKLPNAPADDRHLPDMAFDFYDSLVIFDHVGKTVTVTALAGAPDESETNGQDLRTTYDDACRRIDEIVSRLQTPTEVPILDIDPSGPVRRGFDRSSFEDSTVLGDSDKKFQAAVRRCKEYIAAGDIFQVVLSQRFEADTPADPFDIYRAMRVVCPSPFMFYMRTGPTCLVGASPELMVQVDEGDITLRPLAGTRKRGRTPAEDDALADELLHDEKERAEHVMLVDLGRNDVGRVAEYRSVDLPEVMAIERYSHVMHISSTVTGKLQGGKTALDCLRSCLPAGTVSGAPKVRAMEIIDELEPNRRGPYAGAVGMLDFAGNLETCLALRTLVFQGRKAYIQAGAGIVADSVPDREYDETVNKAKVMLKAIEIAEGWRKPMQSEADKTVLSCIQPTAEMHIGNYFGAVRNWVELQENHRCVYGIVDLHAMTRRYDPDELRANSRRMLIELLACGIDPDKSTLFIQSMVPEHSELCWILSCFCGHGKLERMTQFKDKVKSIEEEGAGQEFVSAGLLYYPILQAADILVYRANYVPVGKDQEQHLELSRDIARRFNQRFKTEFFPEPQPLFSETPKIMSLTSPEKKMSKSGVAKSYVSPFEEPDKIRKKIRSAVTDTGGEPAAGGMSPGVGNLFEILRACGKLDAAAQLQKENEAGTLRYSDLKDTVADGLIELTDELRTRRAHFESDAAAVDGPLREMTERARTLAGETMREVRQLTGLPQLS